MSRWPLTVLLAACSKPTGTFDGRVVDPLTGKGRAGVHVIAHAPNDTMDAACQVTEGVTGADGSFRLDRTCADLTYTLRLDDAKLWAPDLPTVQGGAAGKADKDIAAWRVPGEPGVYALRDDKLETIHSNAGVEGAWIQGTDKKEVATYPTSVPTSVPLIAGDDALVLAGDSTIKRLKIYPAIVHTGPIALELASGAKMTVTGAWYLGDEFESDTKYTKVETKLDTSKVKSVGDGAQLVQIIPASALPAGRYALLGDEDTRMTLVDFGKAP